MSGDARPTVVLGVSGSIAAFKAVEVARALVKAAVRVVPVMTASAHHFLGEAMLSGVCGEPVRTGMFGAGVAGERHVELGGADAVALVPATAELLAALAQGRADDLLRATALCARGPVLVAPAMHPRMWSHPATERNVATLRADGRVTLLGPVVGEVASGEVGMGRMIDPEAITAAILARLGRADLGGLRLLVTAGPTVEDIDPARFLSNRSSGRMGYAIAERAAARGASVLLVSGPVSLPVPAGVRHQAVRSALDLRQALHAALGADLGGADAVVMAAAVADYRPATASAAKLKRGPSAERRTLELEPNPDLLAELGQLRRGPAPYLVGFALETVAGDELVAAARHKLTHKRVDLMVANQAADAFDRDDDLVTFVDHDAAEPLPLASKRTIADRLLDRIGAWQKR